MSAISRRNFFLGGVAAAALASAMPALAMPTASKTIKLEVGYGLLTIMAMATAREDMMNIKVLRISPYERKALDGIIMTLATEPVSQEHTEQLAMIAYFQREGAIQVIDNGTRAGYTDHGWYTERFPIPA